MALFLPAVAAAQEGEGEVEVEVVDVAAGGDAAEAEDDEGTDEDEQDPIEVRVIGDKADAMQKVPGSGTVIRPDEIDRTQPQEAAEMLRRVPGVHVRQDTGGGGRLDIGLRGLDPGRSRRVLLLEDGVPIGNNPYAEPDLYWAPPAERWVGIEVVKGSGSILFGPQTVSGVINFITPYAPWKRTVRLEAKGGQRGFFSAFGRYGDRHGEVGYIGQVLVRRGDGFRAQGFRTVDSLAKVEFPTSDTGKATIKIGIHDNLADADDVGLTTAMFVADPFRTSISPINQQKLRRYHASIVHDHRFDEVVSLKTLAYGYALERTWRRQAYDRFPVSGVRYTRIVGDPSVTEGALYFRDENRVLDRTYVVAGLEPRLSLRFPTGGVHHAIEIGARVLGETAHYEQRNGDTPKTYAGALVLDEDRRTVAAAAYVQDRMAFLDEIILVTPGVRFEYARYRRGIARRQTSDGAEDVDISGESDVGSVMPGVGMTAGTPDMHGFAGVHVGYAPPRAVSSISANGQSEELDEERSLIYEVGARLGERRFWRIEAAGFLNNFFNQVVPSTAGDVTTLVNGGATRQLGLETSATMAFGRLIEHGVLLDVSARYTLMRAQFVGGDNDGFSVPYAPNHLLMTALDVGHDIGFGAQVAYRYVGSQFTDEQETVSADVTGRTGRIDGYHRLDANLRYTEATTGLTATVSIKDILDRPFIISRRPEGIFAAGFRQVTFGLRWDYEEAPPAARAE